MRLKAEGGGGGKEENEGSINHKIFYLCILLSPLCQFTNNNKSLVYCNKQLLASVLD